MPNSMCPVCWLDGTPSDHNFDLFQGKDQSNPGLPYEGPEVGNAEWLLSTIEAPFPISGITAIGNAKPKKRKKAGVLRKIILKFL